MMGQFADGEPTITLDLDEMLRVWVGRQPATLFPRSVALTAACPVCGIECQLEAVLVDGAWLETREVPPAESLDDERPAEPGIMTQRSFKARLDKGAWTGCAHVDPGLRWP